MSGKGRQKRKKSFLRFALFVSFFPQLVAGPIERSGSLLAQLREPAEFDYDRVKDGLLLMLWGYFEKMWIADRAAILVDQVYQDYRNYSSGMLVFATVLFAVQIYCDFGGYSHIAIGAAKVLGIRLMDNFRQPYFAVNCREFWRRWHISLSSWFRDYLYFPLGGSRGSSKRTAVNLMITFLASGLWHGAGWHYVVWGAIHGSYQVAGRGIRYVSEAAQKRLPEKRYAFFRKNAGTDVRYPDLCDIYPHGFCVAFFPGRSSGTSRGNASADCAKRQLAGTVYRWHIIWHGALQTGSVSAGICHRSSACSGYPA